MSRPGIPATEFEPVPGGGHYYAAQYAAIVRTADAREHTYEVFEPHNLIVAQMPITWFFEAPTGVWWGRLDHPFYGRLAIARAVPLS